FQCLRATMAGCLRPRDRLLVVSTAPASLARWLRPLCSGAVGVEPDALLGFGMAEKFDACLLMVGGSSLSHDRFTAIVGALAPGASLVIATTDGDLGLRPAQDPRDCVSVGPRLAQHGARIETIRLVSAGPIRRALARAMHRTIRAGRGGRR